MKKTIAKIILPAIYKSLDQRRFKMKKAIVLILCLMLIPSAAFAGDLGVYLEPKLDFGFVVMDTMKGEYGGDRIKSDDDDTVFGGGLAIGYDFSKKFNLPIRSELEFSYFSEAKGSFSKNGHSMKQKFDIGTIFANAYWDFENSTKFTPYVGAGIGMAFIDSKGNVDGRGLGSKDTTNFAWNLGTGLGFELTKDIDISLGYRFAYLGDAKTKSSGAYQAKSEDIYMHQVNMGLRYTF